MHHGFLYCVLYFVFPASVTLCHKVPRSLVWLNDHGPYCFRSVALYLFNVPTSTMPVIVGLCECSFLVCISLCQLWLQCGSDTETLDNCSGHSVSQIHFLLFKSSHCKQKKVLSYKYETNSKFSTILSVSVSKLIYSWEVTYSDIWNLFKNICICFSFMEHSLSLILH